MIALIGCWVSATTIIEMVAQNAERPGEKRSIMMHQIKTTIGRMKVEPGDRRGAGVWQLGDRGVGVVDHQVGMACGELQ